MRMSWARSSRRLSLPKMWSQGVRGSNGLRGVRVNGRQQSAFGSKVSCLFLAAVLWTI